MFRRLFARPVDAAKDRVNEYISLKMESVKISAVQKASPIISGIIIGVLSLFFVLLIFVFIGIGLSIWIGNMVGSVIGGYMIVAGAYLLFIILLLLLSRFIKRAVGNALAKMI